MFREIWRRRNPASLEKAFLVFIKSLLPQRGQAKFCGELLKENWIFETFFKLNRREVEAPPETYAQTVSALPLTFIQPK